MAWHPCFMVKMKVNGHVQVYIVKTPTDILDFFVDASACRQGQFPL